RFDRDAEPFRKYFEHDDRGVGLAGTGAIGGEHLRGEMPERGVWRDRVVDDLAEVRGELGARTEYDRDLVAFVVVGWPEQVLEPARVTQLCRAIVVEAVLGLVA